jgi:hypothetical protein
MQIISAAKNIALAIFVWISLWSHVGAEAIVKLPHPDHMQLTINRGNSKIFVSNEQGKKINIKIEAALKKILAQADQASIVFQNPTKFRQENFYTILIRRPSTPHRGTGFCSAGYEDMIILLSTSASKIALRDQIEIQSCLKSIALSLDQGDDPIKALDINQEEVYFKYQVLGEEGFRKISIKMGKFNLQKSNS